MNGRRMPSPALVIAVAALFVSLVDPQGRVVATGLWAGATTRRLTYLVGGERRLTVRVVLAGPPGPFTLAITRP
jgi:hypothetical protein